MEKLLEQGAKDAFFTPIFMKKNRPAYKLSVLCGKEYIGNMESIIFRNTTSIGIRKMKMNRIILQREEKTIDTKYGPVRVKLCTYEEEKYIYPEYEEVKNICNKTGVGFQAVYDEIKNSFPFPI